MTTGQTTAAEAIHALDLQIDDAAVKGDAATLGRVLTDDFIFTHGNGGTDTKESWIARSQNPETAAASRTLSDYEVEVHGDVALAVARVDIVQKSGRQMSMKFVRVHKLTPDGWKLATHKTVQVLPAANA